MQQKLPLNGSFHTKGCPDYMFDGRPIPWFCLGEQAFVARIAHMAYEQPMQRSAAGRRDRRTGTSRKNLHRQNLIADDLHLNRDNAPKAHYVFANR
jgi:hypothetical protein